VRGQAAVNASDQASRIAGVERLRVALHKKRLFLFQQLFPPRHARPEPVLAKIRVLDPASMGSQQRHFVVPHPVAL
jgi:hypothetical protein